MFRIYWLLFCACTLLASCFDIREEMVLNRDGSGVYQITLTCHDSLLAMFQPEDSLKMFDNTEASLQAEVTRLRGIEGIHNVNYRSLEGGRIWRLGFEFNNMSCLNKALLTDSTHGIYEFKNKTFYLPGGLPSLAGLQHAGHGEDADPDAFKYAKYRGEILVMAKIKNTGKTKSKKDKNKILIDGDLTRTMQEPYINRVVIKIK